MNKTIARGFSLVLCATGVAFAMEKKEIKETPEYLQNLGLHVYPVLLDQLGDVNRIAGDSEFGKDWDGCKRYYTFGATIISNANARKYCLAQLGKIAIHIDHDLETGEKYIIKAENIEGAGTDANLILATAKGLLAQAKNEVSIAKLYYDDALMLNKNQSSGLTIATRTMLGQLYEKQQKLTKAIQEYRFALPGLEKGSSNVQHYWATLALGRLNELVTQVTYPVDQE